MLVIYEETLHDARSTKCKINWNGTIVDRNRHLRKMLKYFISEIIYLLHLFLEAYIEMLCFYNTVYNFYTRTSKQTKTHRRVL